MQEVQLIISDEAPMTPIYAFEALDITLRDILGYKDLKKRHQIFGGITMLLGGDFRQILPVYKLTRSMRVNEYTADGNIDTSKQDFNKWVLVVGDGKREILTPKNDDAYAINEYMFTKLAGESITYNSADEVCKGSTDNLEQLYLYPTEFLNSLNFPGMPPHALCLKRELPIMLLRNVNPSRPMQWN
ncbi:ATP-dependent DNA helicase PIF1-like protein [Tanacetum coccineum]